MSFIDIWNWIIGKEQVLEEVKPLVADGEAIVADMESLIADLKSSNFSGSIAEAMQIANDAKVFADEVSKVITELQTKNNTPANFRGTGSGPVDKKSKVHNMPHNMPHNIQNNTPAPTTGSSSNQSK